MKITPRARKTWIILFVLALIAPIATIAIKETLGWESFISILSLVDELFVILLFFFSLCIYRTVKFTKVEILLLLFVVVGLLNGEFLNIPLMTSALGCFSTIKSVIIFICFKEYKFSKKEIFLLIKCICFFYFFVLFFDLVEVIYPNFKHYIGYNPEKLTERTRMGFRSISGVLTHTNASLLGVFFYFSFKYYLNKNKIQQYSAAWIVLATVKVKDVFGFFVAIAFTLNKKIKLSYLTIILTTVYLLFVSYSIFLPEHYALYFSEEESTEQARPVLYTTSVQIAKDYFPFGIGFGKFGSPTSQQIESEVYQNYRINHVYGLNYARNSRFMADTFWPMILGENGIFGLIVYSIILLCCFKPYLSSFIKNTTDTRYLLPSTIFIFCFISSFAKPVFSGPPHSFLVFGLAGIFYNIAFNSYKNENS